MTKQYEVLIARHRHVRLNEADDSDQDLFNFDSYSYQLVSNPRPDLKIESGTTLVKVDRDLFDLMVSAERQYRENQECLAKLYSRKFSKGQ